jgi:hypothetical protein
MPCLFGVRCSVVRCCAFIVNCCSVTTFHCWLGVVAILYDDCYVLMMVRWLLHVDCCCVVGIVPFVVVDVLMRCCCCIALLLFTCCCFIVTFIWCVDCYIAWCYCWKVPVRLLLIVVNCLLIVVVVVVMLWWWWCCYLIDCCYERLVLLMTDLTVIPLMMDIMRWCYCWLRCRDYVVVVIDAFVDDCTVIVDVVHSVWRWLLHSFIVDYSCDSAFVLVHYSRC